MYSSLTAFFHKVRIKKWIVLPLALGHGLVIVSLRPTQEQRPPNIVLINVDDLGWKDLGFMGSPYYETPNLDRLAGEGMVFTNAYAAAANCAPSRACLMSGLNTPRHGIYTVDNSDRGDARTRKIIPTPNHEILHDTMYTLAEMLRDNGYVTGMFGKWHLGEDPRSQGFQTNVGGSHNGSPGKGGYFSPYSLSFLDNGPEGEYLTDRLTSESIRFVAQNQGQPFFLYLPFYAVHTPIMGKPELVEHYRKKPGSQGQDNAAYAAMVTAMDQNVGRLLAELDRLGLREQTVVILTSDNGGIRDISYQTPLRAGKGSYYEGGIRVPFTVRWPGRVKAGSRSDQPVTNLDFYPTLQSLTKAKGKAGFLDGTDILPVLKGHRLAERPLYWHFPVYLQAYNPREDGSRDPLFRTRPGSVIRKGDWKLHEYFEDGGVELYNLRTDPGETTNLAVRQPQKVKELLTLLRAWRKQTNAPVPTERNPLYNSGYEQKVLKESIEIK
jgi:arylsulfatase A-like enzyme